MIAMLRPSRARLVHALRLPAGAPVIVRPVGPRDAGVLQAYVRGLPAESRYNRFFGPLRELPPAELDRVIHLDRRRQMAMIAETCLDGGARVIGEARYALAPDGGDLEFALSVADEFRHQGVGMLLMADLEDRARNLGAQRIVGDVLHSNLAMQALARKAGFAPTGVPRDGRLVRVVKDLRLSLAPPSREELTEAGLPIAA